MHVSRLLRKAWQLSLLSFLGGALLTIGLYIKFSAHQLESALKEYPVTTAPPPYIPSLLRPLLLDRPVFYVFWRQIIGNISPQRLSCLCTIAPQSELQLVYEQGGGQYHALKAAYDANRITVQSVAYEQDRELSAVNLRSLAANGEPRRLRLTADNDGSAWRLLLDDEVLATIAGQHDNDTTIGLRLVKGQATLNEIDIRLFDRKSAAHDTSALSFPMGRRILVSPAILRAAACGGLLFVFSNLLWVGIVTAAVKVPIRSALIIDWCNYAPLMALMVLMNPITKPVLAVGVLMTAIVKLWSCCVVTGFRPPRHGHISHRSFRLLLLLESILIALALALSPHGWKADQAPPATAAEDSWIDVSQGLVLRELFNHGIVEISLEFEPASAIEIFFRRIRNMPESDQRYGVILSSDPSLPCQVTEVNWDKIDHWPLNHLAALPATQPVVVRIAIIGDRLRVLVDGREVHDERGFRFGEGRLGIMPVRGRVHVSLCTVARCRLTPRGFGGWSSLGSALRLPGLVLLTALAFGSMTRDRFRTVLAQCLAAMLPAQTLSVGFAAVGAATGAASWFKWPGTTLALAAWLYVYILLLLVIAHRSWFRRPWALIGALLFTTPGFIEDIASRWLPDRELYMKDSYSLNAKSPTPHGAEWYFVPRLRYTNDFHDLNYFRGRRYPLQKPDLTTRIVCLGGSTVACTDRQVSLRQDWPALLEDRLNRFPERHYEVINAGVKGYTTLHVWYWFQAVVRNFHPDVVILSSVFNNHLDFALTSQQQQFERLACDPGGWLSAWRYYARNTRLAMLAWQQLIELARNRLHRRVPAADDPEYKLQLKRFVLAAREQGFKLITVQEPSYELYLKPEELDWPFKAIRSYHDILGRESARYHLPIVDVRDRFRSLPKEELYTDTVHLTDYGNGLLAEEIESAVRQTPVAADSHRTISSSPYGRGE